MTDIEEKIAVVEQRAATRKAAKSWNPWKWILGGLAALGVAIGVYFIMKSLNADQKELAKLRTQAQQNRVLASDKEQEAKLAVNDMKKVHLKAEAQALKVEADQISQAVAVREQEHGQLLARLQAAKSWKDLDAINSEKR